MSEVAAERPADPLFSYFNVAALITLATGICYVVGRGYYNAFYDEIGFSAASILLPTTVYVREGVLPLAVVACLGLVAINAGKDGQSRLWATVGNMTLLSLSVVPLVGLWGDLALFTAFGAVSFLIGVLAVWSSIRRESLAKALRDFMTSDVGIGTNGVLLVGLVCVVFVSYTAAILLGSLQAKNLASSGFEGRQRVRITPKDDTLAPMLKAHESDEMVLIVDYDRKYYVIALFNQKNARTPYIISADQVAAVEFHAPPKKK